MASIHSKLAPKHKMNLATMHDTETYDSLKALFKLVKQNTATRAIDAVDYHQVKWLQGQHVAIELLEKELDKIHDWSTKR